MRKADQTENRVLFQVLRNEAEFFDAEGYGKPFRGQWRPTLLLRDSPACINYHDSGRQNSCRDCPLFSMVPAEQQGSLIPCHYIQLNPQGETIADLYTQGTQELLDQRYRNWIEQKLKDLKI